MTETPGWRPEHTLILAIIVGGASAVVGAVLVVGGVMQGGRVEDLAPTGLAVLAAGVVAALVINALGRKAARRQRPEWLETQAWRSGLEARLAKAQARDVAKSGAGGDTSPKPAAEEEKGGPRG